MSSHHSFTAMADEDTTTFDPQQAQARVSEPSTPQTIDIVHEIRSANAQFSARLDGLNQRLGDMERQQRLQISHPPSPSPNMRDLPSSRHNTTEAITSRPAAGASTLEEAPPASITLQRGPHRARADAAVPPHMARTAAALAASTVNPPSRPASISASSSGSNPLDKYRSMTKGEKSNIKRALASLGLTVPILMDLFKTGEDDSMGSTIGENEQTPSSASPAITTSGTPVAANIAAVSQTSSSISNGPSVATSPIPTAAPPGLSSLPPPVVCWMGHMTIHVAHISYLISPLPILPFYDHDHFLSITPLPVAAPPLYFFLPSSSNP
ncbi:hypothetical protein A4X13_0g7199 [Tilletia indica]|uniref:Uncharacterized protein n=1 Tax=Tilletia indica TaxID=43049 RepID=A0A177TUI2_9BASI|nr:hypothetical protein A4X13_0g7199 [Tilletia indica]